MPFGVITVNTKSFEPRTPGNYSLSTVTFGQPANEFQIRGATIGKDGLLRASVSRILEKDVTVAGATVRKRALVVTNIIVPSSDFTAAELDTMLSDSSEFITGPTLTRVLQGEQ